MIFETAISEVDADCVIDAMMSADEELLVIVNERGYIEKLSRAYAEFLGVDVCNALGRHITEVIENTRLDIIINTGIAEIGDFQTINGEKMIASRIPVLKNGKIIGAFGRVLYRNRKHMQHLYSKIRELEAERTLYEETFDKINTAKYSINDIIGECDLMRDLKDSIQKIARTNSNVLILGESGTGKELFAHSIHDASLRKKAPFVCINCGTIPENLIESELFGYEEGSFTGAKKGGKKGLFHAANGGTVFLDEIGDLPAALQVKLLRVLQNKEIQKIGSSVSEPINIRVIAATNRNLSEMIGNGSFRLDLYYRLNVVTLQIPPLRERKDDLPLLINQIIHRLGKREAIREVTISSDCINVLKNYHWPGNIRELENVLERAVNFVDTDGKIRIKHLPEKIVGTTSFTMQAVCTMKEAVEQAEKEAIQRALLYNNNAKTKAARQLGISRTTLYEKMEKYSI